MYDAYMTSDLSCSVFSMSDVLSVLSAAGKMSAQEVETVSKYIAENKFKPDQQILSAPQPKVS